MSSKKKNPKSSKNSFEALKLVPEFQFDVSAACAEVVAEFEAPLSVVAQAEAMKKAAQAKIAEAKALDNHPKRLELRSWVEKNRQAVQDLVHGQEGIEAAMLRVLAKEREEAKRGGFLNAFEVKVHVRAEAEAAKVFAEAAKINEEARTFIPVLEAETAEILAEANKLGDEGRLMWDKFREFCKANKLSFDAKPA